MEVYLSAPTLQLSLRRVLSCLSPNNQAGRRWATSSLFSSRFSSRYWQLPIKPNHLLICIINHLCHTQDRRLPANLFRIRTTNRSLLYLPFPPPSPLLLTRSLFLRSQTLRFHLMAGDSPHRTEPTAQDAVFLPVKYPCTITIEHFFTSPTRF